MIKKRIEKVKESLGMDKSLGLPMYDEEMERNDDSSEEVEDEPK